MTKRTIRVALLLCDTPIPPVVAQFGTYYEIYRAWLLGALASYPDQIVANNTELVVDGYDVVEKQEYPPMERLVAGAHLDAYDAVMLTGAKHDAFATPAWNLKLIDFIKEVASNPRTQHVKIVGVCFGHQVISVALGGQCERGTNGWEMGVYRNDITDEGRYWWCGDVAGQGAGDSIYVEQMHKDHVVSMPPDFRLCLSSDRYPIHGMVKHHPASTSYQPLAQILTIQGHPEFSPELVSVMVDVRFSSGLIDEATATEARRRLGGKSGTGGEGFGRVGWAIWRMLMQDLPLQPEASSNGATDVDMCSEPRNGYKEGEAGSSKHPNAYLDNAGRWRAVDNVLDRRGPWTAEEFVGGAEAKSFLRIKAKILVIGAGGLGCEILQNLALTGFSDIHVIDMDTIDISNLNRQFLFREADVGKSKALVAADFIMTRVPGVRVTPYHGKIQDHPPSFYMQFDIIIAGLDSISARRWINATLVQMVDEENPESLKPLIDGGTEGFKGQARVILPTISSCYECSIDMLTPPTAFPICTIANTPRLPEHCIEWASVLEWPKIFKDKKLDTDDPDHIEWLYQQASKRATEFKIEGVTWALTQGVVKNIIPAIASTNAIIAASCCNEAFKLATTSAPSLNNYMMYTGNDSVYTFTFEHEKRPECPVCGGESITAEVGKDWTLEKLVDWLAARQDLQIQRPSLAYSTGHPLFFQAPPQLHEKTKPNLEKLVADLVEEGSELVVTDPGLPFSLTVEVNYV